MILVESAMYHTSTDLQCQDPVQTSLGNLKLGYTLALDTGIILLYTTGTKLVIIPYHMYTCTTGTFSWSK